MRVIIADDTALIRAGTAALLRQAGIEVAATAADATALLDLVRAHDPDVVILDIRMPPTFTNEGVVAAQRIRAEFPGKGVLLLSLHLDLDYALEMVNSGEGRFGYLLKERLLDIADLVHALHRIAAGDAVIDPSIVQALMTRQRAAHTVGRLTAREREVLGLMAEGLTNQAIGEKLHLSRRTVEAHVTRILERLDIPVEEGVHRRVMAILAFFDSR
ncbi:two component transcriptional regulator, LuxR family [Streptosporangium subroseum]|uniref:Two component transcriptional regulator, LuxR family n=1 Tax=Streptosporangium subroseum TaxID=106412 RepID=A0A239FZD6_9ACTN|nr:response regulator transcription factor [Streptosporangium subroseum]SNS62271.1 two component transcriptional regulator, LuxR family [Streptosporangium subroseum]